MIAVDSHGTRRPIGRDPGPARKAWQEVWKYVLWGLFWGILLSTAAEFVEWDEPWWRLAKTIGLHLGAGFIVSAIAVFFYEWGAHSKHVIELSASLEKELANQQRITAHSAEHGLHEALSVTFESAHSPRRTDDVTLLVESVVGTLKLGLARASSDDQNLSVAIAQFQEVRQNADTLFDPPRGDTLNISKHIRTKRASAFADAFFAAQIASMQKGDVYTAVSDLASWKDSQLKTFRTASETAVKRGVIIRRTFNIANESGTLDLKTAAEILTFHLQDSMNWPHSRGRYEVGIFGLKELRQTPAEERESAKRAHSGVFEHNSGPERRFVHVILSGSDLSDIELKEEDSDLVRAIWKRSRRFDRHGPDSIETFVRSALEGLNARDRFQEIRDSLDPDFLLLFGPAFDRIVHRVSRFVNDHELILDDLEEWRQFYKDILKTFSKSTFLATSLPTTQYFWGGINAKLPGSMESAIKEFTSSGDGHMKRIFFTKGGPEEEQVMRSHVEAGVEVFTIPYDAVPDEDKLFFVMESKEVFVTEATVKDGKLVRNTVTKDRHETAKYLKFFNRLMKDAKPFR